MKFTSSFLFKSVSSGALDGGTVKNEKSISVSAGIESISKTQFAVGRWLVITVNWPVPSMLPFRMSGIHRRCTDGGKFEINLTGGKSSTATGSGKPSIRCEDVGHCLQVIGNRRY